MFSRTKQRLNVVVTIVSIVSFIYLIGIITTMILSFPHYNFLKDCLPLCGTSYSKSIVHIIKDWVNWVLLSDFFRFLYTAVVLYILGNTQIQGYVVFMIFLSAIFSIVEFTKLVVYIVGYTNPSFFWFVTDPGLSNGSVSVPFLFVFWTSIASILYLVFVFGMSFILKGEAEKVQMEISMSMGIGRRIGKKRKRKRKRNKELNFFYYIFHRYRTGDRLYVCKTHKIA